VGYTGPNVTTPTVIPGSQLKAFDVNTTPQFRNPSSYSFAFTASGDPTGAQIGTVSATELNGEPVTYGITSGNTAGAFAIDPVSGVIRVANAAALVAGTTRLTLTAQDTGLDGIYPLRSASTTLDVAVTFAPVDPDANDNGMADAWEITIFGNANVGSNPPGADPDRDGLGNLVEYALGTHPLQRQASPIVYALTSSGAERYATLTLPKNSQAEGLQYRVEVSPDLSPESWSSDPQTAVQIIVDSASQLIVRDRTAVSGSDRRFMRLRVIAAD
jgi:hypothetical protein